MTPERWEQIRAVLEKALDLAPAQRPAFLSQACSSDQSLRREVETLLASSDDVRSSFLQSLPVQEKLKPNTKLGEYEVKSLLGSGGMGEVYRARDSRLGRDVAIKVLPSSLSAHSGRLRRFEQEARAAAALNHPNILAVFQMGTYEGAPYLVSELLEGDTLRECINRGRLAVRKAIEYGVQIARGLAAAHEKNIVHRDLKPENLFVTKDGRVKILDFGLAKLTQPQSGSEDCAPTLGDGTEPGVVMGTAGYMAPEQVRAQATDPRTDIFAFGAILYEMVSGRRAFQKPTSVETMTAILNEDPPSISQVTTNVPPALHRIVHHCLEKNAEQRFQSASDLSFALDALADELRLQEVSDQRPTPSEPEPRSKSGRSAVVENPPSGVKRWKILASVLTISLLLSVWLYNRWRQRSIRLTEADTIVLGDFANSTGDAVFDDSLKAALNVALRQSPFLNVVSASKASRILKQMAVAPGTKLTTDIAQKLCQRAGSKAYIAGAIGSLGSDYVVALKAVSCRNGDILAQQQITTSSKQKVLNSLGEAASKLREELGESLPTVQRFDVPLSTATTSSLEALQAFALGRNAVSVKGVAATLTYDQRAIAIDPNFAMAYNAVGTDYTNLGEMGRANQYIAKAFQLREHTSEREKLTITARYYSDVTGELEKAIEAFNQVLETYSHETVVRTNIGILYARLGQYEKAREMAWQALRLFPDSVGLYENVANDDLALQNFDEAQQTLRDAQAKKLDDVAMHNALYALAFLAADPAAMAEQQQWFSSHPPFESWGLALASDTETYGGRLTKGRELTKRAVESAIRSDSKENAAVFQAIAAQREAVFGNAAQARQLALGALKLFPESEGTESESALALAMAGDVAPAESLAQDLAKRFPVNTQMQQAWLPAIRTQLALDRNKPALALSAAQEDSPVALGQLGFVLNLSCMYPIYVRGQAYLAAGQGNAAAAQFQQILNHSGIVWNCWTGALAHLGLARANALASRTSQGADADAARVRALAAYKDFFTLWKDADPDLPILKQAKSEYAKLQ